MLFLATDHKPSEDLTKDLQDHVKKVTAPHKYPRKIEYVEDITKDNKQKDKKGRVEEEGMGRI